MDAYGAVDSPENVFYPTSPTFESGLDEHFWAQAPVSMEGPSPSEAHPYFDPPQETWESGSTNGPAEFPIIDSIHEAPILSPQESLLPERGLEYPLSAHEGPTRQEICIPLLADQPTLTESKLVSVFRGDRSAQEAISKKRDCIDKAAGRRIKSTDTEAKSIPSTDSPSNCERPAANRADKTKPGRQQRIRERNRLAAHKCREKTKENEDELMSYKRELSVQHELLTRNVASLKDEVISLKFEILRHANCESQDIQEYIQDAARRISRIPFGARELSDGMIA